MRPRAPSRPACPGAGPRSPPCSTIPAPERREPTMADLLDALKRSPEDDLAPLPAPEVRHRGDRLRHRRRAWQVAGAAAAVAVVVGGGAMLSGPDRTPRELPITHPTTRHAISTVIPSGLPITNGWNDPGGAGPNRVDRSTPAPAA